MKRYSTKGTLTVIGAAVFACFTASASAAVVMTDVQYFENGSLANSDSTNSNPAFSSTGGDYGDASASAWGTGVLNVFADVDGEEDDDGGVAQAFFAFPAPSGAASSLANASWEEDVTNNTGTQVGYKYLFYVPNPSIGTQGGAGDYAGLAIDILLNGAPIWSAFATMDGCTLSHSNMGTPVTGGCEADWASFTAAVDLGVYANGAGFTIGYEMSAFAETADADRTAFARIGDPFDPVGDPAQLIATPVSVPAPGGLGVLAAGLIGFVALRRKRR